MKMFFKNFKILLVIVLTSTIVTLGVANYNGIEVSAKSRPTKPINPRPEVPAAAPWLDRVSDRSIMITGRGLPGYTVHLEAESGREYFAVVDNNSKFQIHLKYRFSGGTMLNVTQTSPTGMVSSTARVIVYSTYVAPPEVDTVKAGDRIVRVRGMNGVLMCAMFPDRTIQNQFSSRETGIAEIAVPENINLKVGDKIIVWQDLVFFTSAKAEVTVVA